MGILTERTAIRKVGCLFYTQEETQMRNDAVQTIKYRLKMSDILLKYGIEEKKQHEIAQKMKAKGQPSDFIADITGLTIEEIEKL